MSDLEETLQALRDLGGEGTPEELARVLDVNSTTLWRWKNGKSFPQRRNARALELVRRLARILGKG